MAQVPEARSISWKRVSQDLTVMGIPASIASVAEPIMEAIDTIIAGRIGVTEIAALGLAVSLILFIGKGFNFLYFGTVSRAAVTWGKKNITALNQYLWLASSLAMIIGTILGIGIYILAPTIVSYSGAVPSIHPATIEYMQARSWSLPAILLLYTGLGLFRGIGKNVAPLLMVFISTIINTVLNLLFVFVLDFGIAGLAWGTNIALWLLVGMYYAWAYMAYGVRIPPKGSRSMPLATFVSTFSFAIPMIARSLLLTGAIASFAIAAAQITEAAGAAHYVVAQIMLLLSMLVEGQMVTIQSLVGQEYGASNDDEEESGATRKPQALDAYAVQRIRQLARISVGYSIVVGMIMTVLFALSYKPLLLLCTKDAEVIQLASTIVWIPIAFTVLHYITYAYDSIIMGIERFTVISWATIFAGITGMIIAVGGVQLWPSLFVVWIGFEVMMTLRLLPQARYFATFLRAQNV